MNEVERENATERKTLDRLEVGDTDPVVRIFATAMYPQAMLIQKSRQNSGKGEVIKWRKA